MDTVDLIAEWHPKWLPINNPIININECILITIYHFYPTNNVAHSLFRHLLQPQCTRLTLQWLHVCSLISDMIYFMTYPQKRSKHWRNLWLQNRSITKGLRFTDSHSLRSLLACLRQKGNSFHRFIWVIQSITLTNYIGIVRYFVVFSLSLFYWSKGVLCGRCCRWVPRKSETNEVFAKGSSKCGCFRPEIGECCWGLEHKIT